MQTLWRYIVVWVEKQSLHALLSGLDLSAKQFQRDMRNTYFILETPPMSRENSACDENVNHSSYDYAHFEEETQVEDEGISEMMQRLATVTAHLDSLTALDPQHVMECVHWGPKPKVISERTRKTIQFLSCTCMEDGLSRKQMRAVLKFIKSLRGPDSALLPKSVAGCWSIMEMVRTDNHTNACP
jgi:hypothetical protein